MKLPFTALILPTHLISVALGRILWSKDAPKIRRLKDVSFNCTPLAGEEEIDFNSIEGVSDVLVKENGTHYDRRDHWTCLLNPEDADGYEDIDIELDVQMEHFLTDREEDAENSILVLDNVDVRDNKVHRNRRSKFKLERKGGRWQNRPKRPNRKYGRASDKRHDDQKSNIRGVRKMYGLKRLVEEYIENENHENIDLELSRELGAIKTEGTSSVLVLRVTSSDSEMSVPAEHISATVFGGIYGGTNYTVNLKSQMAACSNKQFNILPAEGPGIVDGVLEVSISENIIGVSKFTVAGYVTVAARDLLPDHWGTYDHVMYCIPPGTAGKWIGYGYYWYYRTMYNDRWCAYFSNQIHEIGHNLNLRHSGQGGKAYGDQSGAMGYSYSQFNGPKFCYNAAKSSHLGWYGNREVALDPSVTKSWSGKLIGVADYAYSTAEHVVILDIIMKNDDGFHLYLTYNSQKGITSGTKEFHNCVTIVHGKSGKSSNTLAGLAVTENSSSSHEIENFDGGAEALRITFSGLGRDGTVDYALVSVVVVAPVAVAVGSTSVPPHLGTDLAPSSNLTASSEFSINHKIENAVDADMSTQWATSGDGPNTWAKVDFGTVETLTHFAYKSRIGGAQVTRFTLTFSDGTQLNCLVNLDEQAQLQYFDLGGEKETSFVLFNVDDNGAGATANAGAYELHAFQSASTVPTTVLSDSSSTTSAVMKTVATTTTHTANTPHNTVTGTTSIPTGLGLDLAPSAGLTASSEFSTKHTIENAVDADISSQWATSGDGPETWAKIDFGTAKMVTHFAYRSRISAALVSRFTLTFSDGSGVKCIMNSAEKGELQYFDLGVSRETTFVLFEVDDDGAAIDSNAGAYELHIYEVSSVATSTSIPQSSTTATFTSSTTTAVFTTAQSESSSTNSLTTTPAATTPNTITGTTFIPTGLGMDLAPSARLTASSEFSTKHTIENAVDADTSSQWATSGDGPNTWAKIDFGIVKRITHFAYRSRVSAALVSRFTLTFSDDTKVKCIMNSSEKSVLQYFDLRGSRETTFVLFDVDDDGAATDSNAGAYELHVYEVSSIATTTLYPQSTIIASTSSTKSITTTLITTDNLSTTNTLATTPVTTTFSPTVTALSTTPVTIVIGTTLVPSDLGLDLAPSAGLMASSEFSTNHMIENAVDEDMSNEWETNGDGPNTWAKIDFGTLKEVTHFAYRSRVGADLVTRFTLIFSDGSEVKCVLNFEDRTELQYYDFGGSKKTTFVLFDVDDTGANVNTNAGAYELHIFEGLPTTAGEGNSEDPILGSTLQPPGLPPNVAFGASVSASSAFDDSHQPENALDGNFSTHWASRYEGPGAWLDVDFGGTFYLVTHVGYMSRKCPDFVSRFTLLFSDWSLQSCLMNDRATYELQYFDIQDVVTNSIRFSIDEGGTNSGAIEIEIHGTKVDDSTGTVRALETLTGG